MTPVAITSRHAFSALSCGSNAPPMVLPFARSSDRRSAEFCPDVGSPFALNLWRPLVPRQSSSSPALAPALPGAV